MRTLGKVVAFIIGFYELLLTAFLAYEFFGLFGVVAVFIFPFSLLIAPVYILVSSSNPIPLIIVLFGALVWWLSNRAPAVKPKSMYELIDP